MHCGRRLRWWQWWDGDGDDGGQRRQRLSSRWGGGGCCHRHSCAVAGVGVKVVIRDQVRRTHVGVVGRVRVVVVVTNIVRAGCGGRRERVMVEGVKG